MKDSLAYFVLASVMKQKIFFFYLGSGLFQWLAGLIVFLDTLDKKVFFNEK
jgi:hypothetical protein